MEFAKRLFRKPILILLVCIVPAVCINALNPHNWGDDFAQYLMHSQKIAELQNPCEINYMYNPDYAVMSPPAYPQGFPLLLSPISLFKPHTLLPYKIFMQLLYGAFVLGIFLLAKKHFSVPGSLAIALLVAYNPMLVGFKDQILSDIPFALFFILSCCHIEKGTQLWKTGLLVSLTILIRTVGVALLAAWILKLLIDHYKKTGFKFPSLSKTTVNNLVFVFILPLLVFYINQKTASSGYSNQFAGNSMSETVKTNLSLQLSIINNLFVPDLPALGYYNYTWVIFPLLIFTGMIYHLFKKGYFLVLVFSCYEALILIFPYQYATFRFLIPVIPVIVIFLSNNLRLLNNFMNARPVKIISPAFFVLFFFLAIYNIQAYTISLPGPETPGPQQMFTFVKTKTPQNARLLFIKPKAMGYFGQRKCVSNKPTNTNEEIANLLLKYKVNYVVQGLENPGLDHYIQQDSTKLELVFSNHEFNVYKIKGM